MRRIMIFGLALFGAVSMWAQEPEGKFGMELLFNPFSNDFNTFKMGELKGRYFLNEKSAVRFGVGFGIDNETTTDVESYNSKFEDDVNSYTISNKETETKINKSSLKLSLGYEHHVFTKGRLDVYVGGELGWEGKFFSGEKSVKSTSESYERSERTGSEYVPGYGYYGSTVYYDYTTTTTVNTSSSEKYEYEKMSPNNEYNESRFFVNAFTGVDFYIYKGLYIGTELGISFSNGKTLNGSYTQDYNGESIRKVSERKKQQNTSISTTETTVTTTKTNYSYSSETGVKVGKEVITVQGGSNSGITENDTQSAQNAIDHERSNTKLEIYVEPALRIGWRF